MSEHAKRIAEYLAAYKARHALDRVFIQCLGIEPDSPSLTVPDLEAVLAQNERLKSRGIEDMQFEIRKLREALQDVMRRLQTGGGMDFELVDAALALSDDVEVPLERVTEECSD